jgi:hypothetical protein
VLERNKEQMRRDEAEKKKKERNCFFEFGETEFGAPFGGK